MLSGAGELSPILHIGNEKKSQWFIEASLPSCLKIKYYSFSRNYV